LRDVALGCPTNATHAALAPPLATVSVALVWAKAAGAGLVSGLKAMHCRQVGLH